MGAEGVIAIGESSSSSSRRVAMPDYGGGRRLLVGMKLNTSCREMLTWTIAKLAQPGDHILALHVSATTTTHPHEGSIDDEEESRTKQLANTLRGVLSVYESLCNLKQIKLQLEIVSGYKVKNVLVDVASRYDACKLILGPNKSFSVGRTKALGRFCLNRLPCTCTVVILEQGEIIFDKKGRLGADHMTRLDMIKVLRRSMRIGRSRKVDSNATKPEDQDNDHTSTTIASKPSLRPSLQHGRQKSLDFGTTEPLREYMNFGSCSSIIHEEFSSASSPVRNSASGFEALRISFSKRRAQGRATTTAQSQPPPMLKISVNEHEHENERSDMFLVDSEEDAVVPGWPLMSNTIGFETKKKKTTTTTKKKEGTRGHHPSPSVHQEYCREDSEMVENNSEVRDRSMSLAQQVASRCSNEACVAVGFEELEVATQQFSQENVVGRGGGSEVFRGIMRDGRVVAVKRLNAGPQAEEELLIDIEINTTLSHPHIVSLLGYCVEASHMLLVYDYLPHGNLEDHLHAPVGKEAAVLSWEVRHKVAVGIARALEHLHQGCTRPVIHRDVKTSNILLTANFDSQLSDFGLAKWAPTKSSHLLCNDVVGTFGYLAPEYFMFGRVNNKTDVYAFGVVLIELITGRKPIDTTRPKGEENLVNWARPLLAERALNKLVDPLLEGVYDVAQMNNMVLAAFLSIQQTAQRRPQMSQILQFLLGDQDEDLSTSDVRMSTSDPEEVQTNKSDELNNIRSHLAVAMMGMDDDTTSQCSVVDIPHSNKYLEDYLEGRYSRSASFEDS